MNRNNLFIIMALIGVLICLGLGYYLFIYKVAESDSLRGIVFNPGQENDYTRGEYKEHLDALEEKEIGVVQIYVDWADLESSQGNYNWSDLDREIDFFDKRGWKVSLCLTVIDGYALGESPTDFIFVDFYNQLYRERFKEFAVALVDRYGDQIDYLQLGNDIDKYLLSDTNRIDAFSVFYGDIYAVVKKENPDISMGTVFSYDYLKQTGNLAAFLNSLNVNVDFLGFSFYNLGSGLTTQNIDVVDKALAEMLQYSSIEKIALVAAGMSTDSQFSGDENKQKMFVERLLKFTEENQEAIEFVNYDNFKDPTQEYCLAQAEKQLWAQLQNSPNCQLQECEKSTISNSEKKRLADYLCSLGLKDQWGLEREAWGVL